MNQLEDATKAILDAMGDGLGTVNLEGGGGSKSFMIFAMKNQEKRVVQLLHGFISQLTDMLDGLGDGAMPPDWDNVATVLQHANELDVDWDGSIDLEKSWPEVFD